MLDSKTYPMNTCTWSPPAENIIELHEIVQSDTDAFYSILVSDRVIDKVSLPWVYN